MNFMLRKWPTMWRSLKEPVTVWPIHYSIFSFNRALSQKLLCGCTVLNWFKWPPCQGERSGCLYRPVFLLMSWHCKSPHYFICHTSLVSERGISRHNAFFLSCINRERETKKKKKHIPDKNISQIYLHLPFFLVLGCGKNCEQEDCTWHVTGTQRPDDDFCQFFLFQDFQKISNINIVRSFNQCRSFITHFIKL